LNGWKIFQGFLPFFVHLTLIAQEEIHFSSATSTKDEEEGKKAL
jgi:hypothetical protein